MASDHRQAQLIELYSAKLSQVTQDIDAQAIQILRRLKEARFQAYLVGGGVRDLLVDMKPKDFDIATSALPNEVKKKVPYSFVIGRRFKLVHARRGDQIYEIATFRRSATAEELETTEAEDRRLVEENFFGNIEEDSFRRDFTINSLYYDPLDKVIVDHCCGLQDIASRTLKMIGEPKARLTEDPVRILRAVRLSQKLGFTIETQLRTEIAQLKAQLVKTVLPRRREEWLKFFRLKNIDLALMELFDLGVLEILLPTFHQIFSDEELRKEFLYHIRQIDFYGFDLADPTELLSAVLASYALVRAPHARASELADDAQFNALCRDELGVFKAEAATFIQCLQFTGLLKKRDSYLKKGERRQRSLLQHNNFLLALRLGVFTGQLSASDWIFWRTEWDKHLGPAV